MPGGFPDGAPATVRDIPEAQEIARAFFASGKPVAAICHGPWLLAAAGVVADDDSPRTGKTAFLKTYALPVGSGRCPGGRRWELGHVTLASRHPRVHQRDDASSPSAARSLRALCSECVFHPALWATPRTPKVHSDHLTEWSTIWFAHAAAQWCRSARSGLLHDPVTGSVRQPVFVGVMMVSYSTGVNRPRAA